MKIYFYETEVGQAYLDAPADDDDVCNPDPPRSLAAKWRSPTFEIVMEDELCSVRPKHDFFTYLPFVAMLGARAVERLRPILEACGEILPLTVSNDDDPVYLFNVTRVLEAVDMKRSKFMRFPDGGIMKYERLVFDPARIPKEPLFFKTTQLGPVTEIYANDLAVAAVDQADLTGHAFRLVWTNE